MGAPDHARSTSTGAFTSSAAWPAPGVAIEGIAEAAAGALAPPAIGAAEAGAAARASSRLTSGEAEDFFPLDSGSNAYGLGGEATAERQRGMVLGNPHFPWDGAERLYQAHLTIPGKLDVSGGRPVRRPGGADRPHPRPRLVAHGRLGLALHARSSSRSSPAIPHSYIVDGQVEGDEARSS